MEINARAQTIVILSADASCKCKIRNRLSRSKRLIVCLEDELQLPKVDDAISADSHSGLGGWSTIMPWINYKRVYRDRARNQLVHVP